MARTSKLASLAALLRIHHWVKNLLVLVPLVTSHEIDSLSLIGLGAIAFLVFSLAASASYVINDLHDIKADRQHPTKRLRPLVTGEIATSTGYVLSTLLVLISVSVASWTLPPLFVATLLVYVAASVTYSLYIRRILFLDVIFLTGLYCVRIIAGGIATERYVSPWLLGLSLFFFLSLALLKRYIELREFATVSDGVASPGRGYVAGDAEIVRSVGPASGYLSVLFLAFYINSDQAQTLYEAPIGLWLVSPILIYWITRLWLLGHRGEIANDAIVFAARDGVTYAVAALIAAIMYIATVGLQHAGP